jgi:hypothetical protein
MARKLASQPGCEHHVELLTLTLKIDGVTPADLPETLQAALQAATLGGVVAQHSMIEPGCVLLTMDLLMELDMQRPPLTAEGVARQLHTGPAAAFFRKHKYCIRMHDQVVEGNGQHHLPVQQPSTSDWGGGERAKFLAAAVSCCVAPSPTGAAVTILLRGHLTPSTTVTARGGGGKLPTRVGNAEPGAGGLSHMPVSVHLNGLTQGLVYLEVEAAGASSSRALRTIVPVLVTHDAAVRREVNLLRAAEHHDDDLEDHTVTLPFSAIKQLLCHLGMALSSTPTRLEHSYHRRAMLRRLLNALVRYGWLSTAGAVLRVLAALPPLSEAEDEAARQAEEAEEAEKPSHELLLPLHLAVALNRLDFVHLLLQAQGPFAKVQPLRQVVVTQPRLVDARV